MALSETREFLEDLLTRFDPDIDLSDGSRAQVELITPLLSRVGTDPFDDDIQTFITQRIQDAFPDLSISETDALQDTLISPMRVLIEAVAREVKLVKLRSNLQNAEALSDQEIDALMSNFFKSRRTGGRALGTVRAYFAQPVTQSATIANIATTGSGLRFIPTVPQSITAAEMLLNQEGLEYYFDINYQAERPGTEYNIDPGQIISIANYPTATRITNLRRFRSGSVREDALDFIARVQESVSDSTLTTARGLTAEITDNFPEVTQIAVVGFGDPEMKRDIVTGGGMGDVLDDDDFGSAFGNDGETIDDLDGDASTQLVNSATGRFVSRVASAGSDPGGSFISLSYTDPVSLQFTFADYAIIEVLSDTQVRIDGELPIGLTGLPWALRRQQITISNIPGGITLPGTVDGSLVINDNQVNIGGKTDVYLSGTFEEETAQILGLADEDPLAQGFDAQTQGLTASSEDIVILADINPALFAQIRVGMSLVLEEGADAESYPIEQIIAPNSVRLSTHMSGQQTNLSYRVVDTINTELTDPKQIRVSGSDLVTAAGSKLVTTQGATNFVGAGVQVDDILEITDDEVGGDYTITEVSTVTLKVDPVVPITLSGLNYRIFRRSEAVLAPLVRVTSVELLDSSNSPTGTKVPYSEPVLASSRSFQNESSGFRYDGNARVGIVSAPFTGVVALAGLQLVLRFRDAERPYEGFAAGSPITVSFSADLTVAGIAAIINGTVALVARNVRATELVLNGESYLGISGPEYIDVDPAGTANTVLGFSTSSDRPTSNAQVRPDVTLSFSTVRVAAGDLVEFVGGANTTNTRIIGGPLLGEDSVLVGNGPFGPPGVPPGTYAVTPLLPEVGARIRIGRPSVGSARVYFLDPTSAEFRYNETTFTYTNGDQSLVYRPDPDLLRRISPAPPLTDLPRTATTSPGGNPLLFTDSSADFLAAQIKKGDILTVLYHPITSTAAITDTSPLAITGRTLVLRLNDDQPFITITFPKPLTREEVVDYINEQVGEDIAELTGGNFLRLVLDGAVTIADTSTIFSPDTLFLSLAPRTNKNPNAGEFIISEVTDATTLVLAPTSPFANGQVSDTQYTISRYVQRISSTEMNEQQDETQLYYMDVELLSTSPGDANNIAAGATLAMSGVRADGYRLTTPNSTLSFSRAEVVNAEFSRTILIPGSSDSPTESVQLSRQNIEVTYERSQTVDNVQSYGDSDLARVVCAETLMRHLLPHYVSLNWSYVGGSSEPDMVRAIEDLLAETPPDSELEVGDFVALLRSRGATSVYSPDPESSSERTNPLLVVIYHTVDREIRAVIVEDFIDTGTRVERYLPDNILLSRVTR